MITFAKKHIRKLWFAAVGGSGLLLSFVILILGVEVFGLKPWQAYVVQVVVVVEYNFFLNHFITWRDRRSKGRFWATWGKFHFSRIFTVILNQVLFGVFLWFGLPYLLANAICIVTTTLLNYFIGDKFIFRESLKRPSKGMDDPTEHPTIESVSIVIPVKNNEDTIRETVEALFAQDWPGEVEVLVVGDFDDSSWSAISDYIEQGRVIKLEVHVVSKKGHRDSNVKRDFGLSKTRGQVVVVIDSDVVERTHWLGRIVDHFESGAKAVAGPVFGLKNGFWTRFIDQNPVASKTPRIKGISVLDKSNIRYKKPPVTANFACLREVYEKVGGPSTAFTQSYEDYEWFSRMVYAGYPIICDVDLAGERHHREGLRPLTREYIRSGKGCADYIVTHIKSGFAQTRLIQLAGILLSIAAFVVALVVFPVPTALIVLSGVLMYAAMCVYKVGGVEGAVYPLLSTYFTLMFMYGCFSRFVLKGFKPPIHPDVRGYRHDLLEIK